LDFEDAIGDEPVALFMDVLPNRKGAADSHVRCFDGLL